MSGELGEALERASDRIADAREEIDRLKVAHASFGQVNKELMEENERLWACIDRLAGFEWIDEDSGITITPLGDKGHANHRCGTRAVNGRDLEALESCLPEKKGTKNT